jgi:predicted TIM-barrel fold metal-dependent hydrolase
MIIDVNAFTGTWPSHPVRGTLPEVRASLRACGVDRMFVSPLDAAWCRDPHRFNQDLYRSCEPFEDVWPSPVLDPTVATWRREVRRAADHPKVRVVRLLPAYSPYAMAESDDLLRALSEAGLCALVQTRLEDPRRQHPLAQVPDLPAARVVEAAERHPGLKVILGGPRAGEIRAQKGRILDLPNLYADVSQADGMDVMRGLVEAGLSGKLLFGSHAPLFIPHSALARAVTDLDDETAEGILGGNAARMLGWA